MSAVDLNEQSRQLPGDERIRISCLCKTDEPVPLNEDVRSLYAIFQRGRKLAGDGNCLGWIPSPEADYVWMSYNQVNERATRFGSGLINKFKFTTDNKSFIGIYSQNRPEVINVHYKYSETVNYYYACQSSVTFVCFTYCFVYNNLSPIQKNQYK
jgi:hypothetical protein